MFMMRFDMRAPSSARPTGELYAAALEMATFAESRGALDGRRCASTTRWPTATCPSPLVLATAMAARTTTLPIMTAALILPLYDPIRLAEDMVVLDIISGGRVSYVMAVGYRPEEFEHHGADFRRRGRLVEDQLALLLRAKTGEPFEHDGPAHPRHPGAGHARRADGDLGRRQPGRGQAGRPLRPRLLRPGRRRRARGHLRRRRPGPRPRARASA